MSRILGGKQGGRRRGQTFYPQYRPGASLPELVRQVMRMFERRSLPRVSSAGSARAEISSSEQVPVGSMVRSLAAGLGADQRTGHIELTANGTLELAESIPGTNPPDFRFAFTARSMLAVTSLPGTGEAGILYLRTTDDTIWYYSSDTWYELAGDSLWIDDGSQLRPATDGRGIVLRNAGEEPTLTLQDSAIYFGPVSGTVPFFLKQGWPNALALVGSLEITFPVDVYRTGLKHHTYSPNCTDPTVPRTDFKDENSYNDGAAHAWPANSPPVHNSRWFMNVMGSGTQVTPQRGNWQSEIELYSGLGSQITRAPSPALGCAHFSAFIESFLNGQQITRQPAWDVEAFGITRNNFCTMLAPVTAGSYDPILREWRPDTWQLTYPNNATSPDQFNPTVATGHTAYFILEPEPEVQQKYWVYAHPTVSAQFMSTATTGGYITYQVIDAATGAAPVGLPACFNNIQALLAAYHGAVMNLEFSWLGVVEVLVRRDYTADADITPNMAWPGGP